MKDRRRKSDKVKMETGAEDEGEDSDEEGYDEARKKNA
jgi:glycerol-3-phosphate O-acyltransferase/dihydroxyacetone phosphate acyltransferase